MKKLILSIALTATSIIPNTSSADGELIALCEQMLELCNTNSCYDAYKFQRKNKIFSRLKNYDDLRLEYDEKFAAKGYGVRWNLYKTWPKVSALDRKQKGLDKDIPGTIAIAEKYDINITMYGLLREAYLTPDEMITVYNDFLLLSDRYYVPLEHLSILEQYFDERVYTLPRDYLESQGKSYEKDSETGEDPCAPYVEAYRKAIQAPRLAGFNEWLASVGVTNRIDTTRLPTEARITEISSNILNNVWGLTKSNQIRLRLCLGTDKYNEFLEKYASEE